MPACARSAEKKRVKLTAATDDNLPVMTSDRARLRVVIYNLLTHAISRSPDGGTVRAEVKGLPDAVAISISDRGDPIVDPSRIGLLEADDNSGSAELGLSIARQTIEILGGELSARNADEGVEVTVKLPLRVS